MNYLAELPAYIMEIARAFAEGGYPLYLVGGAVRSLVLGLPPADYDLTGPATPQQALGVIESVPGLDAHLVLPRLGTLHIAHGEGGAEYTTFRTESYGEGHTPHQVAFTTELSQDALRRDFSCNALYLDLADGRIIDPTGGLADMENRRLRATTKDPTLIMKDDGLRVLRMVRFALQLRFTIEEGTYRCADASLLSGISRERLGQELALILLGDVRYDVPLGWAALVRALYQMDELGVRQSLLPGCAVDDMACAEAPAHLPSRLAAWLLPSGADKARQALMDLRFSNDIINEAACLIQDLSGQEEDAWILARRGFAHGERLAALRPALRPVLDALRQSGAPDSLSALAVNGEDIANVLGGPSPQVGKALQALWRHAVQNPRDNQKEILLERAQKDAGQVDS